jgi:hypothetical protein
MQKIVSGRQEASITEAIASSYSDFKTPQMVYFIIMQLSPIFTESSIIMHEIDASIDLKDCAGRWWMDELTQK